MTPDELLAHHDSGTFWPGSSGLDVGTAYAHALAVRELRISRGERPLGYKVGFTNRTIWDRYGVHAPIWGTVWDTSVVSCDGQGELSLAHTCQPRLEPEAVFGIRSSPPARATMDQLFDCIEWVAPGFEVVQSHQPGWKFVLADTVADAGLHARLLVGRRRAVGEVARDATSFEQQFARANVALCRTEEVVERGVGSNVLDGPLHALLHFLNALRDCAGAPDLLPGDVVTTGTWTDAWPIAPGERWTARFDPPLEPLEVRLT
jgi:2-oxo-3-hexenedioate decarboxylase